MALYIRGKHHLSRFQTIRRGSICTGLIIFVCCITILLPVGLSGLTRLYEWCLVKRAQQYLQQTLPAVALSVDQASLTIGQARVSPLTARRAINQLFQEHLPTPLQDRLMLKNIFFDERMLPFDPDHWMGERQPSYQPIVVLEATFERPTGGSIQIVQSMELMID